MTFEPSEDRTPPESPDNFRDTPAPEKMDHVPADQPRGISPNVLLLLVLLAIGVLTAVFVVIGL